MPDHSVPLVGVRIGPDGGITERRITRGIVEVHGGGVTWSGFGFTVAKVANGHVLIEFESFFSQLPSIVVTIHEFAPNFRVAQIANPGVDSTRVLLRDAVTLALANGTFHFIAIEQDIGGG